MNITLTAHHIAKARRLLSDLCNGGRVRMTIPARDDDDDMILLALIDQAERNLASAEPWYAHIPEAAAIYGEMCAIHQTPSKDQTPEQKAHLALLRAEVTALHRARIAANIAGSVKAKREPQKPSGPMITDDGWIDGEHRRMTGEQIQDFAADLAAKMKQRIEAQDEAQLQAVKDAIADALGGAFDCTRVWEAWNVGTMSQDDFTLVSEDDDRIDEIARAAIGAMKA